MITPCAACQKPVYPTEKLTCLDRTWHRTCFKCQECGTSLNVKNYKGFEKKPYCFPHYPKMKYTQVAETPENRRLKGNSEVVSRAKYQAEFNKQKGNKISVHDDAAGQQLKQLQEFQSKAQYQKQFKEQIGTKMSIADDADMNRLKQAQDLNSMAKYHKQFNEEIKGKTTATADDLKNQHHKGYTSQAAYQEDYKKNIRGTKTSVTDDVTYTALSDAQSKITGIGYKQKTVSTGSSRPTSMISVGSITEDEESASGSYRQRSMEEEPMSYGSVDLEPGELEPIYLDQLDDSPFPDELTHPKLDLNEEAGSRQDTTPEDREETPMVKGSGNIVTPPGTIPKEDVTVEGSSLDEEPSSAKQRVSLGHDSGYEDQVAPEKSGEQALVPVGEESTKPPAPALDEGIAGSFTDTDLPAELQEAAKSDVQITTSTASTPSTSSGSGLASAIKSVADIAMVISPSNDVAVVLHPTSSESDDLSPNGTDKWDELVQRDLRSCSLSEFGANPGISPVLSRKSGTSPFDNNESRAASYSPDFSASHSPSVSKGKKEKIQKFSDSINVFRTTLTHGALSRLIRDD